MEVKVLESSWTFQKKSGWCFDGRCLIEKLILSANAGNSRAGLTTASRQLSRGGAETDILRRSGGVGKKNLRASLISCSFIS